MTVFFRTRLGKILIWQKIFLKHESPTLKVLHYSHENAGVGVSV